MVMKRVKAKGVRIAELKARLSAYLRRVRAGETITVLDRDTPVARLAPLATETPLTVRPAHGRLQDLRLPPPLALERDVVEVLLEERQGER
jgi:prevent-host-death family protein